MLKNDKIVVNDFEQKARTVDMTNHIMQKEIINLLKEIRTELKKLNKDNQI